MALSGFFCLTAAA